MFKKMKMRVSCQILLCILSLITLLNYLYIYIYEMAAKPQNQVLTYYVNQIGICILGRPIFLRTSSIFLCLQIQHPPQKSEIDWGKKIGFLQTFLHMTQCALKVNLRRCTYGF